jgi:hypothetical protein
LPCPELLFVRYGAEYYQGKSDGKAGRSSEEVEYELNEQDMAVKRPDTKGGHIDGNQIGDTKSMMIPVLRSRISVAQTGQYFEVIR